MARILLLIAGLLLFPGAGAAQQARWNGLFDVAARSAELKTPKFAEFRRFCLAIPVDTGWPTLQPVAGLSATEGYGSDRSAEDFSWAVMVLSGRSLAGDARATAMLRDLMRKWAASGAFNDTQTVHDAYYSLKRQLLPLTVAYAILLPSLDAADADLLRGWLDPLVRRVDRLFDGEVDRNNHRILADSVLAAWGAIIDDRQLLDKGIARYAATLDDARADGTLPLEARRGARALWYQRQTLSSLTVIAEAARGRGLNLYESASAEGRGFAALAGGLLNGLSAPLTVVAYSAENYIPGPENDYLKPDLGFLTRRGHGRHYMAWLEAVVNRADVNPADMDGADEDLSTARLRGLFERRIARERPLVDEFIGGNATCFWGRP